jgi:translocation and assembly module TamA
MTRRVGAALLALLASLLAGCGSLPFLSKPEAPAAAASSPAVGRAVYELEIVAPGELHRLLADYLDLARFQKAPETEGITSAELDRLVAASPAQVRSLLETEGYFNPDVNVQRTTAANGMSLLRVSVQPGPRTFVRRWSLDVAGELATRAGAGHEDATVGLASLRRQWGLKEGQPFRQADWNAAKNSTLARLRAEGYPAATWQTTAAQVDADNNGAELRLVADSGPRFRIGRVTIEGLQRYDEESVRRLSTFYPGDPYSEQAMLDYQDRLMKIGLFEGAIVEIDPNPATAGAAPVVVRVKELPLQAATVGIGYAANTGPRVTLEHTHRRFFGTRWIAKNKLEYGSSLKSWQGERTSHPLNGLYRNLLSGGAERLRSTDELRTSWNVRIGRAQDTPRIERLYYAEVVHSRLDTKAGGVSSDAVWGNANWIFRNVDSVLLPTRGFTLSAQGGAGVARGREIREDGITDGRGPFGRLYGRLTWYRPLPGNWFAIARAEAGQVIAHDRVGVPDTLLFRAGGDESVRGYAYRALGPVINDVVTSGRVLVTGSVEVARPISARFPAFWWAAFVDAGDAANRWGELDPAVGYGVGVRWRSPVGPLRLDVAYGERVKKARLHLSVGVAF